MEDVASPDADPAVFETTMWIETVPDAPAVYVIEVVPLPELMVPLLIDHA